MLIYQIPNNAGLVSYICDSQSTIDAAPVDAQSFCTIGNETDANAALSINQQNWLVQQAALFTCNIETSSGSGTVWTVVDLSKEPPNTTNKYWVIDPTTGVYSEGIGLSEAENLLQKAQQNYLVYSNMSVYKTLTSWNGF